jgi:outer membrane protein TolC
MNSFRNFLKATAAATVLLSLGACAQGPNVAPERVLAVTSKADQAFLDAEMPLYAPYTEDAIQAKFPAPTLRQLFAKVLSTSPVTEQSLYGVGSGHAAVGQSVATGSTTAAITGSVGARDNSGQSNTQTYEALGPQLSIMLTDFGSSDARVDRDRLKTKQVIFEHNASMQDFALQTIETAKDVIRHRKRVSKIEAMLTKFQQLEVKTAKKVAAGYSPEDELLKVQAEIKDTEAKLELAKKERAFAEIHWEAVAGFKLPAGVIDDVTGVVRVSDDFTTEMAKRDGHPRLKAMYAVGQATVNEAKAIDSEIFGDLRFNWSPLLQLVSGAANPVSMVSAITAGLQYQNKSIMDGGDHSSRMLKVIYQFQAVEAGMRNLLTKVDEAINQALSARKHDRQAAHLARSAADLQQRAYKSKLANYEIIGGSTTDLVNALQSTLAAELTAIDADARAELADVRVHGAQGDLVDVLDLMRPVSMKITSQADLGIDQHLPGKAKAVEQASQAQ